MPTRLLVMLWQPDVERTSTLSLKSKLNLLLMPALKHAYDVFEDFKKKYIEDESRLLFVGPEHFFTNAGNAYSLEHKQIIQHFLQEWSKEKPNCIWIPGSVKWSENLPHEMAQRAQLIASMTMPCFRYYKNLGMNFHEQPYFKRLVSDEDLDLIHNTAIVYCNGQTQEYNKQTAYKELSEEEQKTATFGFGIESPIIKFAGLTVGLEIGSDHDHNLLNNIAAKQLIDAHVVLSKSLPSLADAIACHQEGIYVHCDNNAKKNSLVLPFQNGQGQEVQNLDKAQELGLIWWEASIELASHYPSHEEAMNSLTMDLSAMSIQTLRKVNIYPKKGQTAHC